MARILWLNWSGGGNLPPSLGIARVLTERGHELAFAGRPEMVPRVKTAGFRAIEITQAYAQVDRYPQGLPLTRPACYLTSPAVEEEVRASSQPRRPTSSSSTRCSRPRLRTPASSGGRRRCWSTPSFFVSSICGAR